jgi:hypothetical protein
LEESMWERLKATADDFAVWEVMTS